MRISMAEAGGALGVAAVMWFLGDDILVGAAVLVLLVGMKLLSTGDGLFVLPAAYAFHWVETSLGLVYRALTGRETIAFADDGYRPMVWMSLGCCLAIAIGGWIGLRLMKPPANEEERPTFAFSLGLIIVAYAVMTSFEGTLTAAAPFYPSVRQIIVTADTARLGILFLLFRRLVSPVPRWAWIAAILLLEVTLGMTGFFAGFREPLVLATLAILEIFDRRNFRHWAALAVAGAFAFILGVLWMSVRGEFRHNFVAIDNFETSRSQRFQSIEQLSSNFARNDWQGLLEATDTLVDRMWPIYYPSLALARVPSIVPHTNGQIFWAALVHIVTPRVFFPDKPYLESDSDKVRLYSGVYVAGAEQNTTIAFGYAAESYIDFGVPLMFAPVFAFGVAIGWLYMLFRRAIQHRELLVAFSTTAFWLSLYLYERSWAMTLGVTLSMMIYLGVPIVLLDRFLLVKTLARRDMEEGHAVQRASYIR